MRKDDSCLHCTFAEFLRLEPKLKEWFGIDRSNKYIMETFLDYAGLKMKESQDKAKCEQKGVYFSVNTYAHEHFDELKEGQLPMKIPLSHGLHIIENFCKENELGITEKDEAYQILLYAYAIISRERLDATNDSLQEIDYEYQEYTHAIRPDMLKLYIGLRSKNNKELPVNQYHKHCKITFEGSKPIKIDEQTPWFQTALERYLEKYLGVKSVKDAERELNTVYFNKVGAKMNERAIRLMWGTFHLLQSLPKFKSKNEKSVTNNQARIITDLLIRLNLIEYKPQESRIDYQDGERIRTLLKYYLKNYDTLDEIIDARQYKVSPNNENGTTFY